ncbi:MAG TPA: putative toxin-antitoxin system toxin component, PIN family [Mucilaginibacter sp.]|jgi:putative PIN family toxin of toxin-antitoxin system|nr:putative toxin-antitoxin system toxin component, PIN family [Mucilaginibacter sp.]
MIRVVLDTNVVIASISHRSPFHGVWQSFLKGKYELCVTSDILVEYAEVIERRYSIIDAEFILGQMLLRPNLIQSIRYFEWNVIEKDPDDNKFFDCAVAANADFIVSEDKHFKVLVNVPFPAVSAIKVKEFKRILNAVEGK